VKGERTYPNSWGAWRYLSPYQKLGLSKNWGPHSVAFWILEGKILITVR
jgi:hypothetical protein